MTQTLQESTVGQLVVERPARARVFEKLGIDYCCGGKKPLGEACREKGLDASAVLAQLDADTTPQASERNWATASLTDLADHIESTHHAYLREELPRLAFLTGKVADVHGQNHPALVEVRDVFAAVKAELDSHMMKEERILFPLCRQLDQADGPQAFHCGSVANPIEVMIREHEDAGGALERMRQLTDGYAPPADACNTYRAMLDGLHQFERDLHEHIHKENNILFPKAIRAERMLNK